MRLIRWTSGAALMLSTLVPRASGQGANPCAGQTACTAVREFVATVSDFRTSVASYYHIVSVTMHVKNITTHPLILGYVSGSGLATDDRGNRYAVGAGGVRGIGEITGNTFDSKFTLQPGETGDARFEFSWRPASRSDLVGTSYEIDVTLRQIESVPGNQYRLGKESALHFKGFGQSAVAAGASGGAGAPTVAASTPVAVAAGGTSVSAGTPPAPAAGGDAGAVASGASAGASSGSAAGPAADAPAMTEGCAAKARCYASGPFLAELSRVTASGGTGGRSDHMLQLNIRFKNVSSQPIILAYREGSSTVVDNLGNRYAWGRPATHDQSFTGIGGVTGTNADPRFTLAPGASADATFGVRRFNTGNNPLGTSFNYDVVIEQLEILPGDRVRSKREYPVAFRDFAATAPSAAPSVNAAKSLRDIVDQLHKKTKP